MEWPRFLLLAAVLVAEPQHAADADAGNEQGGPADRLQLRAHTDFPPFEADGRHLTLLFRDGRAAEEFDCSAPRAKDLPGMDFRRLELSASSIAGVSSMWANLWGASEADTTSPGSLWLTEAHISSSGGDALMPRLSVSLDTEPQRDGAIEVTEEAQFQSELTVYYDCWQNGEARVELHLTLATAEGGNHSQEICLGWLKVCRMGFEGLVVRHGEYSEWPIYPTSNDSSWPQIQRYSNYPRNPIVDYELPWTKRAQAQFPHHPYWTQRESSRMLLSCSFPHQTVSWLLCGLAVLGLGL